MSTAADSNVTTLNLSRVMKASRAQVYAVWTDTALAREWWGPDGCETRELVCEAHVGGLFRWVLTTPDGHTMTATGVFREVVEGSKVSYTWQWDDDPQWEGHESLVTVVFIDKNAETSELLLTHSNLPSEQSRDNHTGGWNGALDKLERLLAKQAPPRL
ncbi:MAG: hypothetical protein JWO94_2524 [Verrucomicrobiaceae bacterium]|nr:hypothetical protein [Verrucomicrobiaceae bacterium]